MHIPDIIKDNMGIVEEMIRYFGDHNVSIAGGCIRDTLLNKDIKDVDLYVITDFKSARFKGILESADTLQSPYYRVANPASAVCEDAGKMVVLRHSEYVEVDLVFLNTAHYSDIYSYVQDEFDCSVCQVWYNFRTGLGYTASFSIGRTDKTVYWYRNRINNGPKYSNHEERVCQKFYDWRHVNV